MRKGVLIFALIAFALTGGTVYFVNSWLKSERTRLAAQQKKVVEPREAGVHVLVASRDLPAGHIIVVSDLRWQSWPDKQVPGQYIVRKGPRATEIPPNYVGTVVRQGITAGDPITSANLIKLGDRGFLAAVLKPGMRAISVRVNETTSVAGLIYPGDRVDLILTHDIALNRGNEESAESLGRRLRVSETFLTGLRIIAIDQSLEDIKTGKGRGRAPRTVTFEVTQQQAEMITVADRMGTITLALQSLACAGGEAQTASAGESPACADAKSPLPDEPTRGKSYTADSDVSKLGKRASGDTVQVTVLRGTEAKATNTTARMPQGAKTEQ